MKKVFLVVAIVGAVAVWQREELKRWFARQQWKAPDGSSLWDQLNDSIEEMYGGDLLDDGRDHSEKIESLVDAGAVTWLDSPGSIDNGGAVLSGSLDEADPGTVQYLAQTECRLAVRDYGMDPSLEAECRADVVRRGVYGFTSDGVRMAVDIRNRQHTSGPTPNVVTNNDMQGNSGNWQEITEG